MDHEPAEDSEDGTLVLRLWNQSHAPSHAVVEFAARPIATRRVTHIETDIGAARLEGASMPVELTAQQAQTIQVKFRTTLSG